MLVHYWKALAGGGLTTLLGVAGWLYRRYRRSAGMQLQSFRSYVTSSVRLRIARFFKPVLARQFGVRVYADVTLKGSSRRLPIPSRGRSHLDIERAYIRLSLSASPERRIDDEALLTGEARSVLIFGEPGSGKSSLTRKLYREELKRAYLKPFRSRLPLHVELGKLRWTELPDERTARVEWLRDVLRAAVSRVSQVNDPGFVYDAFAKGPGLVLFLDGLDEVPAEKLKPAEQLISDTVEALGHESAGTLIIVTARTQLRGLVGRGFIDSCAEILTVTPFTPADVFAFLRRWEFPASRRLAETQRIFEHLRRNVTLFAMCTNPLVLAMYVAEDELHTKEVGTTVRLADTRVKFYDQVVGDLLYFRRQEQQSGEEPLGTQLLITRQELLGRIALDHLLESDDPANVISLARATALAQKYWRTKKTAKASDDLVRLAVDTGLVTVQQEGRSLQFIHLSICEYLAGKELAERDEQQLDSVLDRVASDAPEARRLWETTVFAVALSKREPRERALRQLTDRGAPSELVLRIIREAQSYDLPVFGVAVDTMTGAIARTDVGEWDTDWIDRVRLVLSCLADAHRLAVVRGAVAVLDVPTWLNALVRSDTSRLDGVFSLYLAVSPAEALRVADELGVRDRLFADQERIVAAMEHPDLIALGMRMIMDGPGEPDVWIDALAEAALRYELVAQTLVEDEIPASLRSRAALVDRRWAWHRFGPAAHTFYGAVLAIAAERSALAEDSSLQLVGRVHIISHVKPSRRNPVDELWRLVIFGLACASSLAALVIVASSNADLKTFSPASKIEDGISVLLVAASFSSFYGMMRSFARRLNQFVSAYNSLQTGTMRMLLNLEPSDHNGVTVPEFFLTRFSDGKIRFYVSRENQRLLDHLPAMSINRWLMAGSLTLCDARGLVISVQPPFQLATLLNHTPLVQVVNVFRQSGPMWCLSLRPPVVTTVFPPRRLGPGRTNWNVADQPEVIKAPDADNSRQADGESSAPHPRQGDPDSVMK